MCAKLGNIRMPSIGLLRLLVEAGHKLQSIANGAKEVRWLVRLGPTLLNLAEPVHSNTLTSDGHSAGAATFVDRLKSRAPTYQPSQPTVDQLAKIGYEAVLITVSILTPTCAGGGSVSGVRLIEYGVMCASTAPSAAQANAVSSQCTLCRKGRVGCAIPLGGRVGCAFPLGGDSIS